MGAVAAVRILHRRRLADVPDDLRPALEQELADEHEQIAGGLDRAVAIGVVDEVIEPADTRTTVAPGHRRGAGRPRHARQHPPLALDSLRRYGRCSAVRRP